jgi:putative transposase
VSQRRACGLFRFHRSSHRYESRKPPQQALRRRLRELALARPRFGYRRLTVLLRREGWKVNHKRVLRLYRLEVLQIPTRRRRKQASESRLPLPIPQGPNELWTMDFMADRLATGERFRTLNVVDVSSRTCIGIAAERSFPSERVTELLDAWIGAHGKPEGIQVDNGTEFTSNRFDAWAYERGIAVHFITPGRPVENAVIESFNGNLRDECLNVSWFETLEEAQALIESWRRDYNEQRPHSSLGNVPPAQYVANLMEWAAP